MTKTSEGLRGQVAGDTAISTVGKEGKGLTYRGYAIEDLAQNARFEEVAYLLIYGVLPNQNQLDELIELMKTKRLLRKPLKEALESIPKTAHPMTILRTACSLLGNYKSESQFASQEEAAIRLMSVLPAAIVYWYRFVHEGVRVETALADDSTAGYFLHLLYGHEASPEQKAFLNTSLILYAEHEFNASTFAARVCAATLSDLASCITTGIGTLRGPLHGGANEAAFELISQYKTPSEAQAGILEKLKQKELIMGFGHAVYRECDPRSPILEAWSEQLSENHPDGYMHSVAVSIDQTMKTQKGLFPNADFYSATAYHFLNIPVDLFTPIFVLSRITGWCAHIFEQRANNRIIRPSANYIGPELRDWQPIEQR